MTMVGVVGVLGSDMRNDKNGCDKVNDGGGCGQGQWGMLGGHGKGVAW